MKNNSLSRVPATRGAPGQGLRTRRWFGVAALALTSLVAIIASTASTPAHVPGILLSFSFVVSAAITPNLWTRNTRLPLCINAVLFGLFIASKVPGNILSIDFSLTTAVVASLGSWLVYLLASSSYIASGGRETDLAIRLAATPIRGSELFEQALQLELTRCRRHERSFCLVILRFGQPLDRFSNKDIRNLNRVLGDSLRWIDQVFLGTRSERLMLICPETDVAGARVMTERLERLVSSVAQDGISIGWACFPDESLTSHELKSEAKRKLRQTTDDTSREVASTASSGEPYLHVGAEKIRSVGDHS